MDWTHPSPYARQSPASYSDRIGFTPPMGRPSLTVPPPPNRTVGPQSEIPPVFRPSVSTALLGAVIGGANALGHNLHQVQRGEMTINQAILRSVAHGAATSLATTTAAALTANLAERDVLHLTALAVTTAGLSYLISVGAKAAFEK